MKNGLRSLIMSAVDSEERLTFTVILDEFNVMFAARTRGKQSAGKLRMGLIGFSVIKRATRFLKVTGKNGLGEADGGKSKRM